jgi:hypothetical protein
MLLVTRDGSTWPARVCALPFGNLHPKLVMDSSLFPMKRAFRVPNNCRAHPEPGRMNRQGLLRLSWHAIRRSGTAVSLLSQPQRRGMAR